MVVKHKVEVRLSKTEHEMEDWIENNTELFCKLTQMEFAEQFFMNTACTISHYVKKIGYENYKEFRKTVTENYIKQKEKDKNPFGDALFKTVIGYDLDFLIEGLMTNYKNLQKIFLVLEKYSRFHLFKLGEDNYNVNEFIKFYSEIKRKEIILNSNTNVIIENNVINDDIYIIFDNFYDDFALKGFVSNLLERDKNIILFSYKKAFVNNETLILVDLQEIYGIRKISPYLLKNSFNFISDLLVNIQKEKPVK
ncbi:hypothetical protein [Mycoplasma sp. 480]|uniref:hypothetical protein n=1 Tax=Mycoplasma sp. 480 TaxID=3440155 RepID=UPI003F516C88